MPFGVVSGVGFGMGVLDFGGDRQRQRGSLGVNLRRPIVTNGDFVASLCGNAYSDRAVVWRGEWGGPRHSCVRWSPRASTGRGCFLSGMVFSIFSKIQPYSLQCSHGVLIDDQLVCEKLTIFPYAECIVEFCERLAFL